MYGLVGAYELQQALQNCSETDKIKVAVGSITDKKNNCCNVYRCHKIGDTLYLYTDNPYGDFQLA